MGDFKQIFRCKAYKCTSCATSISTSSSSPLLPFFLLLFRTSPLSPILRIPHHFLCILSLRYNVILFLGFYLLCAPIFPPPLPHSCIIVIIGFIFIIVVIVLIIIIGTTFKSSLGDTRSFLENLPSLPLTFLPSLPPSPTGSTFIEVTLGIGLVLVLVLVLSLAWKGAAQHCPSWIRVHETIKCYIQLARLLL